MTAAPDATLAERVAEDGYAVLPGLVPPELVERWTAALGRVFDLEADVARSRGWLTEAYRVSYALPAKDRVFVDACTSPALVEAAGEVLGADPRVAGCNGLEVVAGGTAQRLHADHPVPTPGVTVYLHLVVALDDFTLANGATRVVPASHRRDPTASEDPADRAGDAVAVEVGAGGAVAFDATVWHAAGANDTDRPRRALHLFYGRPWVQPHWDFPASMPPELAAGLSDRERRLLGFDGGPARWDVTSRRDIR